jgi:hypothetical protein
MITLDSLRPALTSERPWTELDRLVRAEQTMGRRVKDIQAELEALVEPARDAIKLTDDADDALMDTLDALAGNCAPRWRYTDPPNMTLPTDGEVAKLPDSTTR